MDFGGSTPFNWTGGQTSSPPFGMGRFGGFGEMPQNQTHSSFPGTNGSYGAPGFPYTTQSNNLGNNNFGRNSFGRNQFPQQNIRLSTERGNNNLPFGNSYQPQPNEFGRWNGWQNFGRNFNITSHFK